LNFLAKAGQIILKIIGVATGLVPLLQPILPAHAAEEAAKVSDDLTKVGSVVITAEQMFAAAFGPDAKTGSQKLAAAVPFISQIIQQSELVVGKKIADEDRYTKAITALTSAVAEILSSYEAPKH